MKWILGGAFSVLLAFILAWFAPRGEPILLVDEFAPMRLMLMGFCLGVAFVFWMIALVKPLK